MRSEAAEINHLLTEHLTCREETWETDTFMKCDDKAALLSKEEILALPPEQRPAIGESVIINPIGYGKTRGIVKGKKQKKTKYPNPHAVRYSVEARIPGHPAALIFECARRDLRDEFGEPFPPIITEEEARKAAVRKAERAAQAKRFEDAVWAHGIEPGYLRDFEDFCQMEGGMHGDEIEELREGEIPISEFFDGDYLGDILGVGYDWIIEGDDRCREYPLAGDMKEFLKYHPDKRKIVWEWMQEGKNGERANRAENRTPVNGEDEPGTEKEAKTGENIQTAAAEQNRKIAVKYLVMDVDGTLTDGKIYMGSDGEMAKAFDIKDGCGIKEIAIPAGIIPVIITARESEIVKNRCRELGITEIYQGIRNKLEKLQNITEDLSTVAYIGDDILDLQCMTPVKEAGGLVGCPNDAAASVKEVSDFVSTKNGGDGAVREFIEFICTSKFKT